MDPHPKFEDIKMKIDLIEKQILDNRKNEIRVQREMMETLEKRSNAIISCMEAMKRELDATVTNCQQIVQLSKSEDIKSKHELVKTASNLRDHFHQGAHLKNALISVYKEGLELAIDDNRTLGMLSDLIHSDLVVEIERQDKSRAIYEENGTKDDTNGFLKTPNVILTTDAIPIPSASSIIESDSDISRKPIPVYRENTSVLPKTKTTIPISEQVAPVYENTSPAFLKESPLFSTSSSSSSSSDTDTSESESDEFSESLECMDDTETRYLNHNDDIRTDDMALDSKSFYYDPSKVDEEKTVKYTIDCDKENFELEDLMVGPFLKWVHLEDAEFIRILQAADKLHFNSNRISGHCKYDKHILSIGGEDDNEGGYMTVGEFDGIIGFIDRYCMYEQCPIEECTCECFLGHTRKTCGPHNHKDGYDGFFTTIEAARAYHVVRHDQGVSMEKKKEQWAVFRDYLREYIDSVKIFPIMIDLQVYNAWAKTEWRDRFKYKKPRCPICRYRTSTGNTAHTLCHACRSTGKLKGKWELYLKAGKPFIKRTEELRRKAKPKHKFDTNSKKTSQVVTTKRPPKGMPLLLSLDDLVKNPTPTSDSPHILSKKRKISNSQHIPQNGHK
jgi:hypothetical protein